jgi:hypothetical protein
MQTIMDYSFPDQASIDKWYYSTETTQLKKALPGNMSGTPYADVLITPNDTERTLWWDANHVHFGFVNLAFVSWFLGGDPRIGGDELRAWPDVADLTNAEVIFTVRAYDFYLPGTARIGLWYQARIPDVEAHGPVECCYGNYFQSVDLLDDVLGFGGKGMDRPKTTNGVRWTGWRDWKIRLSPDDAMWTAMGSRLSKTGTSYQPAVTFSYGAAPSVADMLSTPIKANMGVMVAWQPSAPDINNPPAATPCPIFGRLQIKRVRLLVPEG